MKRILRSIACAFGLLTSVVAGNAAGTIPIALSQQVDINGTPLAGCLLYVFQVGTVATPQSIFSDFGLTATLANPVQCDQTGRLPMFYLADGAVHVRLTSSTGVVVFDYPTMQVIGPSSGGGGGGGSVDATTIASTGDIKFRATSETLTGWVRLNNRTIGSATSGANERANADTQALFIYLWTNCPNTHCPVSGGRGGSGLADFSANKTIQLLDWRSRGPVGLDDMGNSAAGRLLASNVTSGGGDGVTTPNATGGEANHALTTAELAAHNHGVTDPGHGHGITDPGHTHTITDPGHAHNITDPGHSHTTNASRLVGGALATGGAAGSLTSATVDSNTTGITVNSGSTGITGANSHTTGVTINSGTTGITTNNAGSGTAHNTMPPFMLGTWYIKL